MMEVLTTQQIVACMGIMALAGLVQALCGFGFGLVAVGLLALVWPDVKVATILPVLPNLVICAYMLWRLIGHIPWRRMIWNYPATLIGVPLGVLFLAWAPIWTVWLGLGLVLIIGGGYAWIPVIGEFRWHPVWTGVPCGLAGGAISGAFGSGGPPTVAYLGNQHLSHEEYTAGLQLVFVSSAIIRICSLSGFGMLNLRIATLSGTGIVAAMLGCMAGLAIASSIRPQTLRRYVQASQVLLGAFLPPASGRDDALTIWTSPAVQLDKASFWP